MPPVNNVWGNNPRAGSVHLITLPSGQTAECIRLGMDGMVEAGILHDTDKLTGMVDQRHIRKVRGGKSADQNVVDVESLMKDPEGLKRVILLVDRAIPHIVVNPEVHLHLRDLDDGRTELIPDQDRISGGIYTDQIGFDDKMHLFNWSIGGSSDASRFLDEVANAVEPVADESGVPRKAKRASRNSRK
jgi:hypothetical protein